MTEIMVLMEKNPNTRTDNADMTSAKKFLYFNWRNTDTSDTIATIKNRIPNTICGDMYKTLLTYKAIILFLSSQTFYINMYLTNTFILV